jgi:hypothetical protein
MQWLYSRNTFCKTFSFWLSGVGWQGRQLLPPGHGGLPGRPPVGAIHESGVRRGGASGEGGAEEEGVAMEDRPLDQRPGGYIRGGLPTR